MKLYFARFISSLFHPIIFATIIPFIVLHNITRDILFSIKWMVISEVFVFLAVLGFLIIRPHDFLHDFDISDRKKRPVFYTVLLAVAIVYFVIATLRKGIFFPLTIVSLGIIIGIVVFEIANRYLKVSIHVAIATAFCITYGIFHGWGFFLATCWIPFAVMWSRVYMKKHTIQEAIAGMALGGLITLLTFAIGKLLI